MLSNLIFYKQETLYSCVPACLRMVLSTFNVNMSEAELRERCDCTVFGTEALKAVDALRRMGFVQTMKCTLSLEELVAQRDQGFYPIVLINLLPIDGVKSEHAVVIATIRSEIVTVYDPLHGKRFLLRSSFDTAWAMMHNLAILVQR